MTYNQYSVADSLGHMRPIFQPLKSFITFSVGVEQSYGLC